MVPDLERRPFRTSGVPKGARPMESYKKATQITRFTEVFGENQQYFNQTSFLMKGQLTPESDFIFSSHQLASYFFINVAPQFNAVIFSTIWINIFFILLILLIID